MDRRVFITQGDNRFNYTAAQSFGTLHFLTFHEWAPTGHPGENREAIFSEIVNRFAPYRPGTDFIVPCGNPVSIMIVGQIMGPGIHNILKWNNTTKEYDLCQVKFLDFE